MRECQAATRDIGDLPHNPVRWTERGRHLWELGYLDLAAGDFYKAILLCSAVVHGYSVLTALESLVRLEVGMWVWLKQDAPWETLRAADCQSALNNFLAEVEIEAYKSLVLCLGDCRCLWDQVQICSDAVNKYPACAIWNPKMENTNMSRAAQALRDFMPEARSLSDKSHKRTWILQSGVITVRCWPWLSLSRLTRNQELVRGVNREFREASGVAETRISTIRTPSEGGEVIQGNDVLGVFATQDISTWQDVLVSHTIIAATSVESHKICHNCCRDIASLGIPCTSCGATYCSQRCQTAAHNAYHKVLCGKDFSWVYDTARHDISQQATLFLRVLAICVQSRTHPLDHPLIARLTASYKGDHTEHFTFTADIQTPIRILQELGVDPFADSRFDTWVLRTIWIRIVINKIQCDDRPDKRHILSVNPLHCFFNHSCEAQLFYGQGDDAGTKAVLCAKRKIKKGEEMFVSYIDADRMGSVEERRKALFPWFGSDCLCSRCRRESKAGAKVFL